MNIPLLVVAALTLGTAEPKEQHPQTVGPGTKQRTEADSTVTSSTILGEWQVTHPNWRGTIKLHSDGRFTRPHGDGGKWQLKTEGSKTELQLNWKAWATETASMVSPDHFRGEVHDGQIELRRAGLGSTATKAVPQPSAEFDSPALKKALSNSTWEMKDGKRFTLHADGTTTGSWHARKGYWRIVGPETIELKIWWKPRPPERLTVEADTKVLRWSDESFGSVAKRVQDVPSAPEGTQR